jgi:hypothetical protein
LVLRQGDSQMVSFGLGWLKIFSVIQVLHRAHGNNRLIIT